MWLYQLTQGEWPVNSYRLDIWEGERWRWEVKKVVGTEHRPAPGDTICFYYAKTDSPAPGFCGWAVVLQWVEEQEIRRVYFRPVAPSDQLKMRPWWSEEARRVADAVRGPVPRGTLWPVSDQWAAAIGAGLANWVHGTTETSSAASAEVSADSP
jgi:hypothetical protein